MPRRLLIVEPQSSARLSCLDDLCRRIPNLERERFPCSARLPDCLRRSRFDLILLVVPPHPTETLSTIESLRASCPTPILAVLPEAATDDLFQTAWSLCDDLIIAPVRECELYHRVTRLLPDDPDDVAAAHVRLFGELALNGLVGRDPAFINAISKIPRAARTNGPVLLVGETGTGKELCARAIHNLGPRRNLPFIPVDCAALPEHLFESELFGHVRGAYTDARTDQKGLVALADGGTLFLDEVDSLSPNSQSKLLRFLQERAYRPLGSDRFMRLDVNVVVATNCDLEAMVREKKFRPDLYFRLNVLRLDLVPLRQRRGDIELLARHFVEKMCAENGVAAKRLTPAAIRRLGAHDWPGNVRQLYNVIQRAVVFSDADRILPSDLDDAGGPSDSDSAGAEVETFRGARSRAIESFERRYVEDLLRQCGGNVSRAARLARKDRRAFGRLVKRYNIRRDRR